MSCSATALSSRPWESFSGWQHSACLSGELRALAMNLWLSDEGIQCTGTEAAGLPRGMTKTGPGFGQLACLFFLQAALTNGRLFTVLLSWARSFWSSGDVYRDEVSLGAEVLGRLHLPLGSLEPISHPAVGLQ